MSAHRRQARDAPGVRGGQAAAKSRSRHDAAQTATNQQSRSRAPGGWWRSKPVARRSVARDARSARANRGVSDSRFLLDLAAVPARLALTGDGKPTSGAGCLHFPVSPELEPSRGRRGRPPLSRRNVCWSVSSRRSRRSSELAPDPRVGYHSVVRELFTAPRGTVCSSSGVVGSSSGGAACIMGGEGVPRGWWQHCALR